MVTPTAPGLILSLDQGGHTSRALIYDARGRELAAAHIPVATRQEAADRVEQDPEELLRSLQLAARDACESDSIRSRPVTTAGLATQRSTIVCWERSSGRPLTSALSWQDRRNSEWLERLRPQAGAMRALTGLVLSPHYGASKMRWCLDHVPAVQRAAGANDLAVGPLASFMTSRLLAEHPFVTDPANAARTLLFDPSRLDWSPQLLDAFAIGRQYLPRCVPTRHDYGTLSVGPRRVPMRACTGDQSAAAFAFGPPQEDAAFVNVGTGAFVQRLAPAGAPLPDGLLRSVLYSDGTQATYSHEGTVNGAASAIDWLRGRTALDLDRALQALADRPETEVPLFMNGVGGLGAPFWMAAFPIEFVGAGDERQQLVAVLESIAFLLCINLAAMQAAAPLRRVLVSGGLASRDYLCSALADLSGLPVERYAVREATARGVAFLAAGQPLDWERMPVQRVFTPSANPALADRQTRWRAEMARRGAVT